MNVFLAFLLISLARGFPQQEFGKYLTSGEEKPPNEFQSALAPPPAFNNNNNNNLFWTILSHAILQGKSGMRWQQDITVEFKDEDKTSDIPPPPSFPLLEVDASRSSKIGARSLSFLSSTPEPLPGDIGVCSTHVAGYSRVNSGKLYSSNRFVNLNVSIYPRRISCRHDHPAGNVPGHCVLAGYPHGAWIIVHPEHKQQHANCHEIPDSPNYTCWDYITVPGYCVLQKER